MIEEKQTVGFEYTFEVLKDGEVIDSWTEKNLVPTEGLNHILGVVLKGVSPVTTWYLGLYEGNYIPLPGDTAATFPGAATECTSYLGSTRPPIVFGTVAGGAVDNSSNKVEVEFTANKTVYGGTINSAAAKGATSGVLLSAVRFGAPKVLDTSSILRVTAGIVLTST